MAESIRLSALGRDVQVGDVYNYFNDAILPSGTHVPKECNFIPNKICTFFYQCPDKFKSHILGISSHLQNSIDQGVVDLEELWFANYMKPNSAPAEDNDIARVDVFIQVFHRIEFLDQNFIDSKMYEYKLNSGGKATHLVEQVVYGAEFICSMQRKINRFQPETKESAEENIFRETKFYFDQIVSPNPAITAPSVKLGDEINCKIFSSLLKADNVMEGSFQPSISWLKKTTNFDQLSKDNCPVPIEIVLRHIPEQIETRLRSEKMNDMRIDIDWNWNCIVKESSRLSKIATLNRVSPLEKVVNQFHELLTPLWNDIEKYYGKILATLSSPDQQLIEFQHIKDLLRQMIDWLVDRRKETETICSLLDGTKLSALDMEDIQTRKPNNDEKIAKVFVLKVVYSQNPLIEHILKVVGQQTSAFNLPFFCITKLQEKLFVEVKNKLHEFANEADLSSWGPNSRDTCYYIGLVPTSSPLDEGTIENIEYYSDKKISNAKCLTPALDDPIDSLKNPQKSQLDSFDFRSKLSSPLIPSTLNQQHLKNSDFKYITTAASPDGTNSTISDGIHYNPLPENVSENQVEMEIDNALSSDSESLEDGERNNNKHSSLNMTEFLGKTKTGPLMEQENFDRIPIQSNKTDITRNAETRADVGQDILVKEVDLIQLNDVEEVRPSSRASVAVSIQKSSSAERILTADESDSNDSKTHSKHSDSDSEQHTTILSKSSRPEKDETTQDQESWRRPIDGKFIDDMKQEMDYKRDEKNQVLQHEESPSKRRIAEIFSENNGRYSKLMKKGQPNVYLLNARETSVSEDFRCFDIGQPEGSLPSHGMRNHKVIILMGATGCGKSTLINGMVNYILGVRWNDPFRFKCVREDETTARNQAHSQTSSVTAYTLRHHEGMAVPYSITIIDTPGYGDTRGVKRDKEITSKIHRFLTQQETRVDEIHAACFVAASGDSRLTATQRYIIDSVLSIFGKDVKPNMRLLVTFADNADPPVVEACLAAQFPVTSASAGITYSKFNSSVLYASNEKHGEDDFCFDELFWDMGQENFDKFFTMLESMNGRNLKSTREVIQRRHLLEQSLKVIEQELEISLANIENMEMFRRKMREYGHKMETNKNFVVEKVEMRPVKMNCDKGFKAYNCTRCKKTCEPPVQKIFKKRPCNDSSCPCPDFAHEFQPFEWRKSKVIVKTTMLDMKAEYESNCDDKMTTEQLLLNCQNDLDLTKGKVLSLLEQVGINARKLDSTALRSHALSPADYLSLMRSRVLEEQAPGYLTRLQTLTELQEGLTGSLPKRQMQTSATHGTHPKDWSNKQRTSLVSSDPRTSTVSDSAGNLKINSPRSSATGSLSKEDDTKTQAKGYQQEDHKRGRIGNFFSFWSGKQQS